VHRDLKPDKYVHNLGPLSSPTSWL
jgi:hypothetical protein